MVRVVSHAYVVITLNEYMGIGQKEVGYLYQHVKQNLSHKGETLLSMKHNGRKYNVFK